MLGNGSDVLCVRMDLCRLKLIWVFIKFNSPDKVNQLKKGEITIFQIKLLKFTSVRISCIRIVKVTTLIKSTASSFWNEKPLKF